MLALCAPGCETPAPAPLPPPVVQVLEVTSTNAPLESEAIGQLDSPQNVQIRARVEGFLDKVFFTEGTEVKQGDPLFELDKKPFLERLASAQGSLAEAEATLNKYKKDVARLQPLAEKRAVPQQDLDNAVASVEVGNAAVLSAKARVQAAQIDLGYCDVKATASGLIGAKQVSIGELVGKGEPTLLTTISALDPIWFYCRVAEAGYLHFQTEANKTGRKVSDLPVTLILSDDSVHPHQGKFVFIDRAVDPTTATLRVRAEFPNPDKLLRPGMFGRIKVDLGVRHDAILVPERAVLELQGKNFVWVVDRDNKTSQRPVKVGDQVGEKLLIAEGLKAGDRIVVEGLQKVREGERVEPASPRPREAAQAPPAPGGKDSAGKNSAAQAPAAKDSAAKAAPKASKE